ncbi:MAG: hypothetical protein IPP32_03200 [Bacteroidetes bacterium]|nr:hypothetical protein [Bacteroidota bacterium]
MKRILRSGTSPIVSNSYRYPTHSVLILAELDKEQDLYCAYTEENYRISCYTREVEHFNPTLKNTSSDGYNNWFSASGRLNRKKGSKERWKIHQPILHPTNANLETRLIYKDGYYIHSDPSYQDAKNLKDFLMLNEFGLPDARIAYINSLKDMLLVFGDVNSLENFLIRHPIQVHYRTAIKAEFGITV